MMKMLIQLDEERVIKDEKYDLSDMWRFIDEEFEDECKKEVQPDGSVLYSGIPNKNYYKRINVAAMILKGQKWFGEYCIRWIWYDNDYNESKPFYEMDVLERQRKKNPLFMQG